MLEPQHQIRSGDNSRTRSTKTLTRSTGLLRARPATTGQPLLKRAAARRRAARQSRFRSLFTPPQPPGPRHLLLAASVARRRCVAAATGSPARRAGPLSFKQFRPEFQHRVGRRSQATPFTSFAARPERTKRPAHRASRTDVESAPRTVGCPGAAAVARGVLHRSGRWNRSVPGIPSRAGSRKWGFPRLAGGAIGVMLSPPLSAARGRSHEPAP